MDAFLTGDIGSIIHKQKFFISVTLCSKHMGRIVGVNPLGLPPPSHGSHCPSEVGSLMLSWRIPTCFRILENWDYKIYWEPQAHEPPTLDSHALWEAEPVYSLLCLPPHTMC